MAYMCMGCYEVYDRDLGYCPKPACYCDVVEIDELMVPAIKMLNEKGFATTNCCSGHIYDNGCNIYISFHKFLTEYYAIDEIKEMFKDLPESWDLEFNSNGSFTLQHMMDYTLREKDDIALYEEIVSVNLELLKFVKELSYLEY